MGLLTHVIGSAVGKAYPKKPSDGAVAATESPPRLYVSSLFTNDDVELYSWIFAHTPLDLVQVVPSNRCLVDEDVLVGVVVVAGTISVLGIKPFDGTVHSLICATAQVALCQVELSAGPPALVQVVVIR